MLYLRTWPGGHCLPRSSLARSYFFNQIKNGIAEMCKENSSVEVSQTSTQTGQNLINAQCISYTANVVTVLLCVHSLLHSQLEGPPCASVVPVRHLNLHEYQSKKLMERFSINTQKFELAETASEAAAAAKNLGNFVHKSSRLLYQCAYQL